MDLQRLKGLRNPRQVRLLSWLGITVVAITIASHPDLLINGLLIGSIYSLGAIGLTLIFGILRFGHFAHGDVMTLGAYISLTVITSVLERLGMTHTGLGPFTFGYPVLIALPIAMVCLSIYAICIDTVVYKRLRSRGARTGVIAIASLGIAIATRGLVQMIWGAEPYHFPRLSKQFWSFPLDIRIPPDNLFLGILALILVAALYLFLNRTPYGTYMRATADNPQLALASGISTGKVIMWTWVLASCSAAIAGTMIAISEGQLIPMMGWKILIPIFAGVILGGIGKPIGALVGSIIVAVAMESSTAWLTPAYKPAIAFVIMIGILLLKPTGIFGDKTA